MTYPNTDVEAFTYDANGNRLSYTLNGQPLNTYTYDNADQLTSDGVVTYTHDLAGNMLTAGNDSYSWDWKNRLSGSTVNGTTASYAYDGDDVRVSQTVGGNTSWYVYDRLSGLPLVVDDGAYGYVHAGGVLEQVDGQGTTDWLLADALGSTRGVADGAGALSGTADFAAFGSVRAQTGAGSTFGFTGEQTDASTGNVYLRARYHNPSSGRFLSADTVQPNAPGSQGYNRYSYTANNPATWTDPSGHLIPILGTIQGEMATALAGSGNSGTLILNGGQAGGATAFAAGVARLALFGSAAIAWFVAFITPLIQMLWIPFVRIAAAIVIFVAAMVLAAVLISIVVELFELVDMWVNHGWNAFVEGTGPSTAVDWTVDGVRTAVQTYPLPPGRQPCTVSGVATEVAQSIVWTAILGGITGRGVAYGTTDLLLDVGVACFSGNGSSPDSAIKSSKFWKLKVVKGTRVYQRDDLIDPNLRDPSGFTNLERMRDGLAPIGPDGMSLELHHMTQSSSSALAEVTGSMHRAFYDTLHINPRSTPSGVNRNSFKQWRKSYWKQRACDFGGC